MLLNIRKRRKFQIHFETPARGGQMARDPEREEWFRSDQRKPPSGFISTFSYSRFENAFFSGYADYSLVCTDNKSFFENER